MCHVVQGKCVALFKTKRPKIGNSTSSGLLRGERKKAERAVVKNDTGIPSRVQSHFLIGPSLPYRHLWLNCLNKSLWSSAAQIWSDGSCSITHWRGHVKLSPVIEPNPKNNIHPHKLWSVSTTGPSSLFNTGKTASTLLQTLFLGLWNYVTYSFQMYRAKAKNAKKSS